jgi:hypothetical protein
VFQCHFVGFDSVTVCLVLIKQQLVLWSHSGRFDSVTVGIVLVKQQFFFGLILVGLIMSLLVLFSLSSNLFFGLILAGLILSATVDLVPVPVKPQFVLWSHSGSNIVDGLLLSLSLELSLSNALVTALK